MGATRGLSAYGNCCDHRLLTLRRWDRNLGLRKAIRIPRMANRNGWVGSALASTALMPLLWASVASAQSASQSTNTSIKIGASAGTDVGEVIVTATRKEQSLSK